MIREVARRTGVSHNAAYRHFADRDDLLGRHGRPWTSWQGSRRRDEARVRVTTPESARRAPPRLREVGKAYVDYALAEPGLFAVAFARDHRGGSRTRPNPYALLGEALDEPGRGRSHGPRRAGAGRRDGLLVGGARASPSSTSTAPSATSPPPSARPSSDRMLALLERGLADPA